MSAFLSRKFLLAVAGFFAAVASGNVPAAAGIVVAYLTAEGVIDAKSVDSAREAAKAAAAKAAAVAEGVAAIVPE